MSLQVYPRAARAAHDAGRRKMMSGRRRPPLVGAVVAGDGPTVSTWNRGVPVVTAYFFPWRRAARQERGEARRGAG